MSKPQRAVWRKTWKAKSLNIVDEPMALSLLKYNADEDRSPSTEEDHNLVSSHVVGTKLHAPILDLDFPHTYIPSTAEGHGHLYLDVPISGLRWRILMIGLFAGKVVESGYFWWSMRRGANYMRRPGLKKTKSEEVVYTHGMFFKLRKKK